MWFGDGFVPGCFLIGLGSDGWDVCGCECCYGCFVGDGCFLIGLGGAWDGCDVCCYGGVVYLV